MLQRWGILRPAFLLVAALVGSGCDPVVSIEPEGHTPVLAVFALFHPEQEHWQVEVRQTMPLNSNASAPFLSDATVAILQNGQVIARPQHMEAGMYVAEGAPPEPGSPYTLRVQAPGFVAVTATSEMPEPVTGLAVAFIDSVGAVPGDFGDLRTEAAFTMRFEDAPGRRNYYQMRVIEQNGLEHTLRYTTSHPAFPRDSFREVVRTEGVDRTAYVNASVSDETFAGQVFEAELRATRQPVHAYRLRLGHLSEDYYRYLRSQELQEATEENPFAEPVIVHSNIEGGVGIFAGYLEQDAAPIVLAEITPARISGHYAARTFRYRPIGESEDVLQAGGRLELVLVTDQTVSGRLVVPAAVHPEGRAVEETFQGTYSIDEGAIAFHGVPDFLAQASWYFTQSGEQAWLRLMYDARIPYEVSLQRE